MAAQSTVRYRFHGAKDADSVLFEGQQLLGATLRRIIADRCDLSVGAEGLVLFDEQSNGASAPAPAPAAGTRVARDARARAHERASVRARGCGCALGVRWSRHGLSPKPPIVRTPISHAYALTLRPHPPPAQSCPPTASCTRTAC